MKKSLFETIIQLYKILWKSLTGGLKRSTNFVTKVIFVLDALSPSICSSILLAPEPSLRNELKISRPGRLLLEGWALQGGNICFLKPFVQSIENSSICQALEISRYLAGIVPLVHVHIF